MKRILMYLLPLLGILWSCTVDERVIEKPVPEVEPSNEVTLNFSVKVPGQSTPSSSTRSMNETAENYIETIDVLVFEVGSSGNEEYLYRAQGKNIQSGISASEKSFEVTLIKQPGLAYRLVVLANASSELNALEPIGEGAEKELLLERLIYKNTSEWNATDPVVGMFDPFPMWGESQVTAITDNMEIKELKFLRMAARVDVVLNPAVSNFKLRQVYVYNRQTSGHIVPNMADTVWTEAGSLKVKRATIPVGSPLMEPYENVHLATGDTACVRDIYLMESKAGTTRSDATCIVVGGEYGASGSTTYYRLDFLESDKVTYKDILRNHLYRITINSVSGAGYGSPGEAFNSLPLNMDADILEWDEGEMSEVVFDGQYMLSVSQGEFTFSKVATTETDRHNILTIYTDYDVSPNDGWKIEKIVDSLNVDIRGLWLNVSETSGPSYAKSSVHILLEDNETNTDREGYIHISAGRLSYIVKVTQTDMPDLKLAIYAGETNETEITELNFYGGREIDANLLKFTVEWAPRTESPLVNINMVGSQAFEFDLGKGSDNIVDGKIDGSVYQGQYRYTVVPLPMTEDETDPKKGGNPFLEKSSRIDFTVSNGMNYLTKNIYLRHFNYGIDYKTDGVYILDGKEHNFIVKSNTTWTAKVTNNPNNIIELVTTSGGNNITGEKVKFITKNDLINSSIFLGVAEITFSSPRFNDVVVNINCASAEFVDRSNSYIVKPGGVGILIPVDRANQHSSDAIRASDEFTAELLWTDNSNLIGENSNIRFLAEVGSGRTGHIMVLPGTGEGNAVVAVRNKEDDQIKWSWHIWVTNYDAVSDHSNGYHNFMDRNLGALTNTENQLTSLGLLYQWGRKDPFPGGNATTSSTGVLTVYNASGTTPVPAAILNPSSGTQTLSLSIANPTTYYRGSSNNNYDWYSATANIQDNNLWGGASNSPKSIYDPCPEGWRVPSYYRGNDTGHSPPWSPSFIWTTNGSLYNGYSYYPAAGYYSYLNSSLPLIGVGTYGLYWSASPGGTNLKNANHISLSDNINHVNENTYRASGFSVRCEKTGD